MRTAKLFSAAALLASLPLLGCSGDDSASGGQGGGDGSGNDSNTGGSGGTGFGTGGDGGGTTTTSGCKKVDLVFSVDNSSSMSEEKTAMASVVFPAFATALLDVGGGLEDYRIGVLDACPTPAGFHSGGAGGPCNFASGEVWMDSSDPDLVSEFGCVGDIDSSASTCTGNNDDEQPASTAAAALEPPASVGPNTGFLRDDALLVVVAITDEDEQPVPSADAQAVHDRLAATKGGDPKKMVFLGIGGLSSCTGAYGSADQAVVLKQISDLFTAEGRGVFWDLCAGELQDGLGEAMGVIEQACDEFPPPQ